MLSRIASRVNARSVLRASVPMQRALTTVAAATARTNCSAVSAVSSQTVPMATLLKPVTVTSVFSSANVMRMAQTAAHRSISTLVQDKVCVCGVCYTVLHVFLSRSRSAQTQIPSYHVRTVYVCHIVQRLFVLFVYFLCFYFVSLSMYSIALF
jgi:hypothetical protein